MTPTEKAKRILYAVLGVIPGEYLTGHEIWSGKEKSIDVCDEIISALKVSGSPEFIVDNPSAELHEMKMIGGVEYWERVKIALQLLSDED